LNSIVVDYWLKSEQLRFVIGIELSIPENTLQLQSLGSFHIGFDPEISVIIVLLGSNQSE